MATEWVNDIHQGDAGETLAEMPESSVHMCMTSPPYWNLRDYGEDGQLGLEETAKEYVNNIAGVCDEIHRVLRNDGSLWLNLGDTYDDKDLQQIPARVSLELQARGWTLRNRVTWEKPNPMPNSVSDRLNTTTEAIFHLTPNKRYWYDLDSIREPYAESYQKRAEKGYKHKHGSRRDEYGNPDANHTDGGILDESGQYGDHMHAQGKNPGDVFKVTTKPFADAHFAVYPQELCKKPIKASCPPKVCVACGEPYEREVEREAGTYDHSDRGEQMNSDKGRLQSSGTQIETPSATFKGWEQTCNCETDQTEAGIVLDPFSGAGTTALVAKDLGRRFVGIELNPEYVAMSQKRVGITVDEPERLLSEDETSLEAFADGGNYGD